MVNAKGKPCINNSRFAYVDFYDAEDAQKTLDSQPVKYDGIVLRIEPGSAQAVKRGAPWVYDPKGLNDKKPSRKEVKQQRRERRNPPQSEPAKPNLMAKYEGQRIVFED